MEPDSRTAQEITDEALAVHLYQHRVRIDGGRAGPIESRAGNAAEPAASDQHHPYALQPHFQHPDRIGAREQWDRGPVVTDRGDVLAFVLDELQQLHAE